MPWQPSSRKVAAPRSESAADGGSDNDEETADGKDPMDVVDRWLWQKLLTSGIVQCMPNSVHALCGSLRGSKLNWKGALLATSAAVLVMLMVFAPQDLPISFSFSDVGRGHHPHFRILGDVPSDGIPGHDPCWCAEEQDSMVPIHMAEKSPPERWKEHLPLIQQENRMDERRIGKWLHPKEVAEAAINAHALRCPYCEVRESPKDAKKELSNLVGKHLLLDDHYIQDVSGLQRFLSPAMHHPDTMIPDCTGTCGFVGSINYDGRQFMMHFRRKVGWSNHSGKKHSQLNVAFSNDGINWRTMKTKGLTNTNIGGEQCVLHDKDEPDKRFRYKMIYDCFLPKDEMCVATSEDGITWEDFGSKNSGIQTDTQPCLYRDASDGSYEIIAREEFPTREYERAIRGVILARVSREDFMEGLKTPGGVIPFKTVDRWYFGRFGTLEVYRRAIYAMTRTKYQGVYFGFVHLYEWGLAVRGCPRFKELAGWQTLPGIKQFINFVRWLEPDWKGLERVKHFCNSNMNEFLWKHVDDPDTVQPYLVTSRDGVHYNFQWVYSELPLQLGQRPTDGFVMPAGNMVTAKGYHWVYFSRNPSRHRYRFSEPDDIRLARFEQDRMIGLRAESGREGVLLTKPFKLHADAAGIALSVDIAGTSAVHAEMLVRQEAGMQSYILGNWTHPLKGQARSTLPVIKDVAARAEVLQLRVRLHGQAKLFAFAVLKASKLQGVEVPNEA
mmetsp:Transcript_31628/g.73814  ORF Transcript_31628/g.73814 Transcript_31628/m.73814 type:complete len:725 (+) Transcript_31628:136-2310(+)